MLICEVVRFTSRNPVIGEYLPLNKLDFLLDSEEALKRFQDQYPILMGDLNVDLDEY